jgi:O-antigen ligase
LFGVLVVAWFMAAHIGGSRNAKWVVGATVFMTLLSLSRSALAAQLLIVVLAQLGTTTSFRTWLKAAAVFTTIAAIAVAAVFLYAPLHHRFFGGDKQQIAGLSVNVSGRDALWSANWAWFKQRPVIGWGAGSSDRMTSMMPGAFASHPHNDYLRLLVDFGFVGIVLWCVGYLTLMRLTWIAWRETLREQTIDSKIQAAAFLALVGIAVAMLVDNPLIEVGKMAPLGAIVGLALGTAAARGSAQAVVRQAAVPPNSPGW